MSRKNLIQNILKEQDKGKLDLSKLTDNALHELEENLKNDKELSTATTNEIIKQLGFGRVLKQSQIILNK